MTSLTCFFLRGSSSRVVLTAPFSDNIHSKSVGEEERRGTLHVNTTTDYIHSNIARHLLHIPSPKVQNMYV